MIFCNSAVSSLLICKVIIFVSSLGYVWGNIMKLKLIVCVLLNCIFPSLAVSGESILARMFIKHLLCSFRLSLQEYCTVQ
jgi:hypothetical protein